MSLPERLYYPLSEAAKKLNCTEQDVIHFGAIGAINLSVYIHKYKAKDNDYFHLNISNNMIDKIDFFDSLSGEGWNIFDVKKREFHEDEEDGLEGYYSNEIEGFFYINSFYLTKLEFDTSCNLELIQISTGTESGYDDCIDVNFLTDTLSIDRKFLCVKKEDIYNFKESTKIPTITKEKTVSIESPKTIAKKSELIHALLKLIPEISDLDTYTTPVSKIAELIEAIAAKKEIEIPKIHRQTLANYLGRERKSRKK